MATSIALRKSSLVAAILCSICTTYANADDFAIKVQQYAQTTPLLFKTTKSIPESQQKLGADLLRLMAQAQSKSLPEQNVLMSKSGQLPIHIIAKAGQGQALENQLKNMKINVQSRVQDDIMGYIMPLQLGDVTGLDTVESANLQGTISAENTATSFFDRVKARLNTAPSSQTQTTTPAPQVEELNISRVTPALPTYDPNRVFRSDDDGVRASFSNLLQQRNLSGKNIKIGVIDFGYRFYGQLQTQDVVPKPAKSFTFSNGMAINGLTTDATSTHGTACVEIIHAMAPDAEIYVAQVGNGKGLANDGDVLQAIDWLIRQGVNIINFSGGGHSHPHDGTSLLDKKVSQVLRHNILWVNAAGNEGNKTWTGKLVDQNKNNLIDIGEYDNLIFEKKNNSPAMITLNWDDWKTSKSGYQYVNVDAIVVTEDKKTGRIVQVVQASEPRTPNSSALKRFTVNAPAGKYALLLRSNKQAPKAVQVFFNNAELETTQRNSSITVPGTSPDALTVAAWSVRTTSITPYSSIGLTVDGRMKPDISAPTAVFNRAYQLENAKNPYFHGTSAAAPHATGFAALLWQQQPNWTAQQLKQFIIQNSTREIGTLPNFNAGYGLIDARKVLTHTAYFPVLNNTSAATTILTTTSTTPVSTTTTVTPPPIVSVSSPLPSTPLTTSSVSKPPSTPVTTVSQSTSNITRTTDLNSNGSKPVNTTTTPQKTSEPVKKTNEVQDLLKRLGLGKQ